MIGRHFSTASFPAMVLTATVFFLAITSVTGAAEVFLENFTTPGVADLQTQDFFWDAYRGDAASVYATVYSNSGVSYISGHDGVSGYAYTRPGNGLGTLSGVTFDKANYASTVPVQDASFSWWQKANDGSQSQLAVCVGADWYVSDSVFTTPSNGWEAQPSVAISSISQWYQLSMDDRLTVAAAPTSLPTGTLLGAGLYMSKSGGAGVCRWDDFSVSSPTGTIEDLSTPPEFGPAYDSASDPAYADAVGSLYYNHNYNGGTGFQPWTRYLGSLDALTAEPDASARLCYVPDFHATSLPGRPFRTVDYGIAMRTMDRPLGAGDIFSVTLDADPESTGKAGIHFYDNGYSWEDNQRRLSLETVSEEGGDSTWQLTFGELASTDTGIPVSAGPIDVSLTFDGGYDNDEYSIAISTLAVDGYGNPLNTFDYNGYLEGIHVNGIDRFKVANLGSSTATREALTYFDNFRVDYTDSSVALDTGSDTAYAAAVDASVYGLNGGTGFGAWEQQSGAFGVNFDLDPPEPKPLPYESAFLVSGGRSDVIAQRTLDFALEQGDSFSAILHKSKAESGGNSEADWVGMFLYNADHFSSDSVRIQFGDSLATGTGNWSVWDRTADGGAGGAILDTGIVADDTPVRVTFTVTGEETYDLTMEVWDYDAEAFGAPILFSDVTMTSSGLGSLGALRMYDMNDCGDFYFNNLTVARGSSVLEGDCNGDGHVNSSDLDIVRGNWGQAVSGAAAGDLSGDGVVSSADLDVVRGNWGATASAAVPEPTMFTLLTILAASGLCLVRRR